MHCVAESRDAPEGLVTAEHLVVVVVGRIAFQRRRRGCYRTRGRRGRGRDRDGWGRAVVRGGLDRVVAVRDRLAIGRDGAEAHADAVAVAVVREGAGCFVRVGNIDAGRDAIFAGDVCGGWGGGDGLDGFGGEDAVVAIRRYCCGAVGG